MKAISSVLISFLFASALPAADSSAQLSTEERRVLELTPAVVFIAVNYTVRCSLTSKDGQLLFQPVEYTATGSGFIYRPDGYIITNGHVVADANLKDKQAQDSRKQEVLEAVAVAIQKKLDRRLSPEEINLVAANIRMSNPQIHVILNNKASYNGEIKIYSDPTGVNNGKDVAVIKIDATNLPTIKLGNSDRLHVQEAITAIGYPGVASPLGMPLISMVSLVVPTVTNGHISAVKTDYKGTPVIQSDTAITHGNSGGPAFDVNNEAIGIATYGNAKEVAGFNFFVPINTALEFVHQAGANPESGQFDKTWNQALDAFSQQKWETARGLFSDVLGIMPNEPDAMRLQNIAAQQAREEGPMQKMMESSGTLIWPVGGLVAVLFLSLLGWKAMSSKKRVAVAVHAPPPPPPPGFLAPPPPPPAGIAPSSGSFGTIHITAGSLNGNRFPVPKAGLMIGRDSTKCGVVISDDSVSKEHAWVVPLENEVVVIDRGSANGTYINSSDSPRVNKVALKNGDRILLGRKGGTVLTYFSS